ncbi:MAG: ArsR family transcriptional regulator [Candidatus Obscuribacterales bacterium]|nr:ArsR family transcriptional regulator [Candidatus Obscuribacterales bacterium]
MKKLPISITKRKLDESAREGLLRNLKLRGEMTVEELCSALKITHTAVRRHLLSLKQQELIVSRIHQSGTGRPSHKYKLTEKAALVFPSGYERLAGDLLDSIYENSGHKGVMDFLRANNDRIINELRPSFQNKDLKKRVEDVCKYFVDGGYMTDWKPLPDGNFFIFHQNCAILNMAMKYRQFCILEPRLIEALLGVKISRQQYILKNQPICGYLVDSKQLIPAGQADCRVSD